MCLGFCGDNGCTHDLCSPFGLITVLLCTNLLVFRFAIKTTTVKMGVVDLSQRAPERTRALNKTHGR